MKGLRTTLVGSRGVDTFLRELEARIRQFPMVDGRVLPAPEVEALRLALLDFLRTEALVTSAARNPSDALRILDLVAAYAYTASWLEGERAGLVARRAAKFPPPPAAKWPELTELRAAASQDPAACSLRPPVDSVYFGKALDADGLTLPEDVLALYAWANGFDLSCVAAPHLPVFSFLPAESLDIADAVTGHPRRVAAFQGGDTVQLSVYRDRKKQAWLVYEHDYEPIGKQLLDLPALLRFGLRRMHAATPDLLEAELSWDRYFGVGD